MSYVVLARKYRPRRFADMVGQPHVVQALGNALRQNRLHHAWLFTGTRGVGKTTVSRILAKSLNCVGPDGQGGITDQPCGVCPVCRDIDADRFLDYIELDAASNRGIDEIRDLLERASYQPAHGRFKVFMIDEAHQLTRDAFNALLKTLEEPPPYLKFVLATTDPEKMLPTVLSRCLQFNLRAMTPELVRGHLAHVLAQEGIESDDEALRLLGTAARGSMRDALSLTDQAIACCAVDSGQTRLTAAAVRDMLGLTQSAYGAYLAQALARRDGPALLAVMAQVREQGAAPAALIEDLMTLLQDAAVSALAPQAGGPGDAQALMSSSPESAALLPVLQAGLPPQALHLAYSLLAQGRGELIYTPDDTSGLLMLLLRVLAFLPPLPPDALPDAVPLPESPQEKAPAASAAAAIAPAPEPVAAPIAEVPAEPAPAVVAEPAPPDDIPPWLDADDAVADPPPAAVAPLPLPAPAPGAVAKPAAPVPVPQNWTPTPLGERWLACVQALTQAQAITALVRELALQSELTHVDDSQQPPRWTLHCEGAYLVKPENVAKLEQALRQNGFDVALEGHSGAATGDTPARRLAALRAQAQAAAEHDLQSHPVAQALAGAFPGARWLPGSIQRLSAS
ncbi:DNA polymerase III subunit gamma/tau [Amphibiibacter pelophylacis]|uniref:DNA polymerase III subunit gamma/tau n=1 Tax=Amphibiibacter pelophylacis TaxID=1799477 RepID=A0ACC6NZ40_9BURK